MKKPIMSNFVGLFDKINYQEYCESLELYINHLEGKSKPSKEIEEVVEYLNLVTRKKFTTKTKETVRLIGARLKEGFTVGDCKVVIDLKAAQWLKDDKMNKYLCPSTLFAQSNFEKYINEMPKGVDKKPLGFEIKVDNKEYNDYVCKQKNSGDNWMSYNEWLRK